MKILMVCLGNICRSPIAEGVMRAIALKNNLNWQIASAGIKDYHIGEPPHNYSPQLRQKSGVDIPQQRARSLVAQDFEI